MKFGFRTPSLTKRISARMSAKRVIAHSLGLKAPRGMGLLTNPKKAAYNRIYNKTTIDPLKSRIGKPDHSGAGSLLEGIIGLVGLVGGIAVFIWVIRLFL